MNTANERSFLSVLWHFWSIASLRTQYKKNGNSKATALKFATRFMRASCAKDEQKVWSRKFALEMSLLFVVFFLLEEFFERFERIFFLAYFRLLLRR